MSDPDMVLADGKTDRDLVRMFHRDLVVYQLDLRFKVFVANQRRRPTKAINQTLR
jgi:hypothetical protein